MTLRAFIAVSVLLHLLVITGVAMLPEEKKQKTKELFAKLVTPEEARMEPVPVPPPPPLVKPVPIPPVKRMPQRPVQPPPLVPRTAPTPDRPVVPEMGKEGGRPLPEGITPKGDGREGGEGKKQKAVLEPPPDTKPGYLDRSRLFDPSVIAETAVKDKAGRGKGTGGTKDDAVTFDTREYRFAGYMKKLKEKIESIWQYPPEAVRKGIYGDLKIRFTIGKDGRLRSVELARTSGYKMLDDAAIKALKDGEPYWPLPDEWGMDTYTVQGHFIYSMYGYGLR
ncbi:MAG: hypothetical protein OHK006_17720 [Thermodesulfovibrionales bacterium]